RVFPLEPVDDRIEADAFERHARLKREDDFVGELADPLGATCADVTGFRDENRTLKPCVGLLYQATERNPTLVAWFDVPVNPDGARVFPLIVVIEVHAYHV